MINLPNFGDRVKVWPFPGRKVQLDARPVATDKGGRYCEDEGQEVVWSEFHYEQYRQGDLLLHPPPAAKSADVETDSKSEG